MKRKMVRTALLTLNAELDEENRKDKAAANIATEPGNQHKSLATRFRTSCLLVQLSTCGARIAVRTEIRKRIDDILRQMEAA